jgi:tRNA-2-methylthio-N6-dimethylallyladenosine synthase
MFKYSAREHTRAAKWPETVSGDEKNRRLQRVIELQEARSGEINRRLIGTVAAVLVEGPARRREGWLAGKTPQFKTTVFPADDARSGDLVRVQIVNATAHTLLGELLGEAGERPQPAAACEPVADA